MFETAARMMPGDESISGMADPSQEEISTSSSSSSTTNVIYFSNFQMHSNVYEQINQMYLQTDIQQMSSYKSSQSLLQSYNEISTD